MTLTEVLTAVRGWLAGVDVPARVLADREDALWVIFETDHALAELTVGDGAYTPYRFVSFQVLDVRLDANAAPVFSFYDDGSHTTLDILRALERGLAVMRGL